MSQENYQKLIQEYSQKENEWKKEKAILEQKNELLELQLQNLKNRENHQKQMYETMMSAFTDISKPQNKPIKDIIQQYENEQSQMSSRNDQQLEQQLKQKAQQYEDLQQMYKELQDNHYNETQNLKEKLQNQENERIRLQQTYHQKIQILEQQQLKDMEYLTFRDSNQKKDQCIEKLEKELQQVRNGYQKEILELQNIHFNSIQLLNNKLEKSQNMIKKYQTHLENTKNSLELENRYKEEIMELKLINQQLQVQCDTEKKRYTQKIEELEIFVKSLEFQNQLIKQRKQEDTIRISVANFRDKSFLNNGDLAQPTLTTRLSMEPFLNHPVQNNIQESSRKSSSFYFENKKNYSQSQDILPKSQDRITSYRQQQNSEIIKTLQELNQTKNDNCMPMPLEDFNTIQKKRLSSGRNSHTQQNKDQLDSSLVVHNKIQRNHTSKSFHNNMKEIDSKKENIQNLKNNKKLQSEMTFLINKLIKSNRKHIAQIGSHTKINNIYTQR